MSGLDRKPRHKFFKLAAWAARQFTREVNERDMKWVTNGALQYFAQSRFDLGRQWRIDDQPRLYILKRPLNQLILPYHWKFHELIDKTRPKSLPRGQGNKVANFSEHPRDSGQPASTRTRRPRFCVIAQGIAQ